MKDLHPPDGKVIYFDCYSGISGDMTLGALLDLGAGLEPLRDMLSGLDLPGWTLDAEAVSRGGIAGTKAHVRCEENAGHARRLPEILDMIEKASLPGPVRDKSAAVFQSLAEAEASVHGTTLDQVHFHEVGAIDAIIDIVGSCAALYLLGVDQIYCSPLPAGRGAVQTAHGILPLPAPATLELLARRQAPLIGVPIEKELVTPTGAAIVSTLADSFGDLPPFRITATGYGAGTIQLEHPNYLRLLLGNRLQRPPLYATESIIIETNIDDLNPEIYGYLMERLFSAGALDVTYTPVQMKKNRPGILLTVLAPPEQAIALQDLIFFETSTLGLRLSTVQKIIRPRRKVTVLTRWGPIGIKYCPLPGNKVARHYAPEYEDCVAVAKSSKLPLREVYRLASRLYRKGKVRPS